jgi:hypothetical protein
VVLLVIGYKTKVEKFLVLFVDWNHKRIISRIFYDCQNSVDKVGLGLECSSFKLTGFYQKKYSDLDARV